jgi:hypothetical protein
MQRVIETVDSAASNVECQQPLHACSFFERSSSHVRSEAHGMFPWLLPVSLHVAPTAPWAATPAAATTMKAATSIRRLDGITLLLWRA